MDECDNQVRSDAMMLVSVISLPTLYVGAALFQRMTHAIADSNSKLSLVWPVLLDVSSSEDTEGKDGNCALFELSAFQLDRSSGRNHGNGLNAVESRDSCV